MKKSSFSDTIGNIFINLIFTLLILVVLGLAGFLLYLDFYISKPVFSLIWVILLPIFGLMATRLLDHFVGDKYYNPNWVYEARSGKGFVKPQKRQTKKILINFIECLLFILLLVRFIILAPLNKVCSIIGVSCSIVAIIAYFIIGIIPKSD